MVEILVMPAVVKALRVTALGLAYTLLGVAGALALVPALVGVWWLNIADDLEGDWRRVRAQNSLWRWARNHYPKPGSY